MRVLHLFANHKWTGPAELALQQVRALNESGPARAELALAGHHDPARPHAMARRAAALGLPLREGLALRRHFHLPSLWRDARELARWIDSGTVDLLHCHQGGDHLVAALARRLANRRPPLVRSFWEAEPPGRGPRTWLAFRDTDMVLAPFLALAAALGRRLRPPPGRLRVMAPILGEPPGYAVDQVARQRQALRAELDLDPGAFLIGLTARIQPRRRWTLAWDTIARLARRHPRLHLCVLGRPDEGAFERLCRQPLAERGLTHRVHFLGYREGGAYFDTLAAFDAFLFLVPGSDATCRALREAMAMGLPAVTTDLGHLPAIVRDGETGLVRTPEPDALSQALDALHGDALLRERLGRAARSHARHYWSPQGCVRDLAAIYRALKEPT